jgi:hypothetical protein
LELQIPACLQYIACCSIPFLLWGFRYMYVRLTENWLEENVMLFFYFILGIRNSELFFAFYAVDEVYVDLGDLVWLYDGFGSGFPMQNLEENQLILKYMECKESHLMFWLLTMEKKVRKLTGVVFNKLLCVNDCMCLPIIITFLLIDWFVKFYIFSS